MSRRKHLPSAANIKWSGKLLEARNFILLTDKDSVIRLQGLDPMSTEDITMVTAQKRALEAFDKKLHEVIDAHRAKTDSLGEVIRIKKGDNHDSGHQIN